MSIPKSKSLLDRLKEDGLYDPNILKGLDPFDSSSSMYPYMQKERDAIIKNKPTPSVNDLINAYSPEIKVDPNTPSQEPNFPSSMKTDYAGHPVISSIAKGLDVALNNPVSKSIESFGHGILDSASAGILPKLLMNEKQQEQAKQLRQEYSTANLLGELTGYVLPFAAGTKVAKPLIAPLTKVIDNPYATSALTNIVGAGLTGLVEGAARGDVNPAERAVNYSTLTGAVDSAVGIGGKLISKFFKHEITPVAQNISSQTENPILQNLDVNVNKSDIQPKTLTGIWKISNPTETLNTITKDTSVTPTTLSGTYKSVNRAKLENKYDELINKVHNYYMTSNLRQSEVDALEHNLGFGVKDLNTLLDRIEEYKTKGTMSFIKEHKPPLSYGMGKDADYNLLRNLNTPKTINDIQYGTKKLSDFQHNMNSEKLTDLYNKVNTIGESTPKESIVPNVTTPLNIVNSTELSRTPEELLANQQGSINIKPEKVSNAFDRFYTKWFNDIQAAETWSDRTGDKFGTKLMNNKKVSGTVTNIFKEELVDPQYNPIGESLASIMKDVPKGKEADFSKYLVDSNALARYLQDTPINPNISLDQHLSEMDNLLANNPEFKPLQDRLNSFMTKFTDAWLAPNMVSRQTLNQWHIDNPNFVPLNRVMSEMEHSIGSHIGGLDSEGNVIKEFKGSERDITDPIENIMNMINRIVRTVKNNDAKLEIVSSLEAHPEELADVARILPSNYKGNLSLDNIIPFKRNGQTEYIQITDNVKNKPLLDVLTGANKGKIPDWKVFSKATQIFKGLITDYNPFFTTNNFSRDLTTAYGNSIIKNPVEFSKNYYNAISDMKNNTPLFKKYNAMGGEQGGFFSSEDVSNYKRDIIDPSKMSQFWNKSIGKIHDVNSAIEKSFRYAEFKAGIEKGLSPEDAFYNSGEVTTNFSRGGKNAKFVNYFTPYFNPMLQGLDRFARSFQKDPMGMTQRLGVRVATKAGKYALTVSVPMQVLKVWNETNDPEGYKALDNRTKDAYNVISTGNGKFIKFPKAREAGVLFGALLERVERQIEGDPEAWKGFKDTVYTNFSPISTNPIENNLAAPFIWNIPRNKDFAGRDIVPDYMNDWKPSDQYDDKTSALAKEFGQVTGLSPKQVDYIINSYSGVLKMVVNPENIKNRFVADSNVSNQNTTDFYDNLKKLSQIAAHINQSQNIESSVVTPEEKSRNIFNTASSYMAYIRKNDVLTEDQKRQQINNIAKTMNEGLRNSPEELKSILRSLRPEGFK